MDQRIDELAAAARTTRSGPARYPRSSVPAYNGLVAAAALLRVMGVVVLVASFALLVLAMAEVKAGSLAPFLIPFLYGVGAAVFVYGMGEALMALRDIAQNSFR